MIVNKYYKVIKVIKDSIDGPTPFYLENISTVDYGFKTSKDLTTRTLFYKIDDGEWYQYISGVVKVSAGSKIYLMGDCPTGNTESFSIYFNKFSNGSIISDTTTMCNVGGYLTSLCYTQDYDTADTLTSNSCQYLFVTTSQWSTYININSLENLITDNILYTEQNCCNFMFGYNSSTFNKPLQNCVKFPDTLFQNVKIANSSSFNSLFGNCNFSEEGVKSFSNMKMFGSVEDVRSSGFNNCFQGCTGLTTLPEGMFSNLTSVGENSFSNCFHGCNGLTTLPEGMFSNVTSTSRNSFNNCFQGCTGLTTLPEGMFSNLTSVGENSFSNCFRVCTGLTTLPEGMFSNVTSFGGSNSFSNCFQGCTSLQTLNNDLFINVKNAVYQSFSNCFQGCTSLTTIPSGLFSNITQATGSDSFKNCFGGCTSLIITPNFKNIASVSSSGAFSNCFDGCSNLQLIYAPSMSAWTESYFQDWVKGVYPTGKMYVKSGVVPPTGTSGVPEGWQLLNY